MTTVAVFTPGMYDKKIEDAEKSELTLTEDHLSTWQSIPGPNDIQIMWNHWFYSVQNLDDVSLCCAYQILGSLLQLRALV